MYFIGVCDSGTITAGNDPIIVRIGGRAANDICAMRGRTVTKPRAIKRYLNRRLYDPVAARYFTLADVCRLVRKGVSVSITEQKTGKDQMLAVLFDVVLSQELSESDPGVFLLTPAFLLDFIRSAAGPERIVLGEFLKRSLRNLAQESSLKQT